MQDAAQPEQGLLDRVQALWTAAWGRSPSFFRRIYDNIGAETQLWYMWGSVAGEADEHDIPLMLAGEWFDSSSPLAGQCTVAWQSLASALEAALLAKGIDPDAFWEGGESDSGEEEVQGFDAPPSTQAVKAPIQGSVAKFSKFRCSSTRTDSDTDDDSTDISHDGFREDMRWDELQEFISKLD